MRQTPLQLAIAAVKAEMEADRFPLGPWEAAYERIAKAVISVARRAKPEVVIRIDHNSRIDVMQEGGASIYLLDERIDPHLVLISGENRMDEILEAVGRYELVSILQDDLSRTAADLNHQLRTGQIVVAGFSKPSEARQS